MTSDPRATALAGLGLTPAARALVDATLERDSVVPAWVAAGLARDAGAATWAPLGAALACLYAGAHLLDDLADGDASGADWAQGSLTAVELVAACRRGLHHLGLESDDTVRAHALVSAALATLVDGQRRDLADRERAALDPWETAANKSGASVGAFFALAALVAGEDEDTWRRVGAHAGALGQAVSDVASWLQPGPSEDWDNALPTVILHEALHSEAAPAVRQALAGPRAHTRSAALVALGREAAFWERLAARLEQRMAALDAAAPTGPLRAVVHAGRQQLDAVWALRPTGTVLLVRLPTWGALEPAARAFLDADPTFTEATVTHRWGFDGRSAVAAGTFGPLVVLEARLCTGDTLDLAPLWERAARAERWGWRYFDGFDRIPVDIDTCGLALQTLAAADALDHPAATIAQQAIAQEPTAQGLLSTWRAHPRDGALLRWESGPCPVATANALVGMTLAQAWSPRMDLALAALDDWIADGARDGGYYAADVARGWVLLQRTRLSRAGHARGPVDALCRLLLDEIDLRGRAGTVLGTAAAVRGLRAAGVDDPRVDAACTALGEGLLLDGGGPADPWFPSVAPGVGGQPAAAPRWVRSRLVTTAWIRAALLGRETAPRGARWRPGLFG